MKKYDYTVYDEFLTFRSELIKDAINNASYTEDREDGKVRPVVKIASEEELNEISQKITKWRDLVDQLVAMDPIRFDRKATVFSPEPQLVDRLAEISIRECEAVSTRVVPKENILRRMRNILRNEIKRGKNADNETAIDRVTKEIEYMEQDDEVFYQIRSEGYTDVVALVKIISGSDPIKFRVPLCGLFYYDPLNNVKFSTPDESVQLKVRKDVIANNIAEIPHSLTNKSNLYRDSEALAHKGKSYEDEKILSTRRKYFDSQGELLAAIEHLK